MFHMGTYEYNRQPLSFCSLKSKSIIFYKVFNFQVENSCFHATVIWRITFLSMITSAHGFQLREKHITFLMNYRLSSIGKKPLNLSALILMWIFILPVPMLIFSLQSFLPCYPEDMWKSACYHCHSKNFWSSMNLNLQSLWKKNSRNTCSSEVCQSWVNITSAKFH